MEVESIDTPCPGERVEALLFERHKDRIYRYLLRLTGDPETAADLTQETFFQAIRDLRRAPGRRESPTGWLMCIATNRAMDLFRRQRLIRWLPFLPDRHGGACSDEVEVYAHRDLVATTLRLLPPDVAAVLILRDAEGFSTCEIATMMKLEEATVRKRLSRARQAFRAKYEIIRGES